MKPTQQSLAIAEFEVHRKRTRHDEFLAKMDQVVPWALIGPVHPKSEGIGSPTVGLERMLRTYFLQQWFNLPDPAAEQALYDSASMRQFVGNCSMLEIICCELSHEMDECQAHSVAWNGGRIASTG